MTHLESVDNALRLLFAIVREGRLGVTEAAHELGVAPSTAHRLLATLRHRGFVVQTEDRHYVPGPAIDLLTGSRVRPADLITVARPHLERLRNELDETCHLMVRIRREVRFLASYEAGHVLRVSSQADAVMPCHLTSGGKAILAELSSDDLDLLYPRAGAPQAGLDALAVRRLRRELRASRQRGYGLNREASEYGIAAVGVCLRESGYPPMAAVSVTVPTVRYSVARLPVLLVALRATSDAISSDLALDWTGTAGHDR